MNARLIVLDTGFAVQSFLNNALEDDTLDDGYVSNTLVLLQRRY
jgi:hypothetical protein